MSPPRIHSRRHPTPKQSRNLLASFSFAFFLVLSIILLCPVSVKAEEVQTKPEYGTVIGIGVFFYLLLRHDPPGSCNLYRSGYNVSLLDKPVGVITDYCWSIPVIHVSGKL